MKQSLRKYTSLPILLDMLVNKRITFVSPLSWEDRNDAFYIEKYQEIKKLKTVLVLCFTTKSETFSHWKVFAGNPGGVCIRFDRDKLISYFDNEPTIRSGPVNYKYIRDLRHKAPSINKLPFLKRKHYEDEQEFRILYESSTKTLRTKVFDLDLKCIERITLSPWMPYSVCNTVKNIINSIHECSSVEILRTGVIENSQWKKIATNVGKK
jgi:hypothetical protein